MDKQRKQYVPLGTRVARLAVSGDVTAAYRLRGSRTSWSVAEARGIRGACKLWNIDSRLLHWGT